MIKLNLGAGIQHWGGFINVDKYVTPERIREQIRVFGDQNGGVFIAEDSEFVQADMMELPFADNSVDLIETIDTIEHFGFREVGYVIAEMKRVLKPGAIAKIQTIDFSGLAKEWIELIAENPTPELKDYMDLMQGIYGNQIDTGQFHKAAWTPVFAYQIFINEMGFSDLKVLVLPKGCSTYPPMETIWKSVESAVYIHQALYFEVTK